MAVRRPTWCACRTPARTGASVTFANLVFTALSSGAWANGNLLIDVDYNGVDQSAATGEPTAFNLTITNLEDGTVETFPSVSLNFNKSSYVLPVVNDPDTGSQLVNVALAAPWRGAANHDRPSARRRPAWSAPSLDASPRSTPRSAAAAPRRRSPNKDFGITLTTVQPPPPLAPLPIDIKVFASGGTIPQTVAGLAARVEQTINAALAIEWPGASVSCSAVTPPGGADQAIRVVGTFPGAAGQIGNNDAVIAIAAPPRRPGSTTRRRRSASARAGMRPNVAHYTLGTGNVFGSQTASVAGSDGTGLPGTAQIDRRSALVHRHLRAAQGRSVQPAEHSRRDPRRPPAIRTRSIRTSIPTAIYGAAITLCEQSRAMLLVDPPPPVRDVASAVDWKTLQLAVHSPNGAAYFPRLRLPDPANNYQLRTFAPVGRGRRAVRADRRRARRVEGAGRHRGDADRRAGRRLQAQRPRERRAQPARPQLLPHLPDLRPGVPGARARWSASDAEASQWKYVPVRRLALYIEESLYRGTKWAVFEPNDEPLWAQLRLNIGAFMHDLFRQGAFQGSSPSHAYLVKCDKDTTTQNDIDAGIVNILVGFAPLKPAEFVVIQIQQLAGQLQT